MFPPPALLYTAPFHAPGGCPAFTVKEIIGYTVIFPIADKEIAPNDAGDGYNEPIERAEEEALNRVTIFMGAKAGVLSRVWDAEKNEDSQR